MKKIIALLVALSMTATPTFGTTKYYENTTITELAPGVEKIVYHEVNDEQTLVLNMIKVDLNEPSLSIDTLTGKDNIKSKFALSDVVSEKTIAAINGDYFNSRTNEAIGPMIADSKWLQSGYADQTLSSFMISTNQQAFIDYVTTPSIKAEFNGSYIPFDYFNMNAFHLSEHQRIIMTTDFRNQSFGTSLGLPIIEVVVKNNIVTEIRENMEPTSIPEDGFIMLFTGGKIGDAINLTLGTKVKLAIDNGKNDLDMLLRGGAKIIENNQVVENTMHEIKNRHPRTAIGIADDGKTLYLITVDGRQGSIEGLTQKELASVLLKFNISDAMCFDGGGSTELMSKLSYEEIASITNQPSDGRERNIYNGIEVKYTNDQAEASSFRFASEKYYGVIGFPINLVSVALDQNDVYYNTIDKNINYSVSGISGYFSGNTFIPTSSGNGTISANYLGNQFSISVFVEDNFKKMSVSPQVLQLNKDQHYDINAFGFMSDGRKVEIPSSNIHIQASDTGLLIDKNEVSLIADAFEGYITVKYGELAVSVPATSNESDVLLTDFTAETGQLKVYPNDVIASYQVTKDGKGKLDYDFTRTTKTRAAYIDFDDEYTFNDYPNSISIDVDGTEAYDQWLRGIIIDGAGNSTTIDFTRYLSKEELTLSADVPKGLPLPLSLKRVYVVETRPASQVTGTLYFDNLVVNMPVSSSIEIPREENNIGTLVVIDPDRVDSIIIDENTTSDIFEMDYSGGKLLAGRLPFNELIHQLKYMDSSKRLWILNLPWLTPDEEIILKDILSTRKNDVYFYNYQDDYQMSMYLGYPHIKGPTLKIVKSAFSIYGK